MIPDGEIWAGGGEILPFHTTPPPTPLKHIINPVYPEPTLTVENVAGVMEKVAVERRKEVWFEWGIVPDQQLEEIYQKYSTEEQRIHACADIYVNCNPDSSWTHLHKGLYGWNEMTAAKKAKTFIPQTGERTDTMLVPLRTCT